MQILLLLLFAHSAFFSQAPDPYDNEEFDSKLEKYEEDYDNDYNICTNVNFMQKTDCWKVNEQLQLKESFECCHAIGVEYSDDEPGNLCSIVDKTLIKSYIQPKYYAMFYEVTGYYSLLEGEFEALDFFTGEFTCSSGNYTSSLDVQFTDEEKVVFSSSNHCLNYNYKSIYNSQNVSKNQCLNAVLLDSTKKVGITCGYYEFNFIYEGKEMNLNTCYFVNLDLLKVGSLDYDEKTSFDEIVAKYIYQENWDGDYIDLIKIPPYTFKVYSDEKNVSFYDSTKNTLVAGHEESKDEESKDEESKAINISKPLILILLFLL